MKTQLLLEVVTGSAGSVDHFRQYQLKVGALYLHDVSENQQEHVFLMYLVKSGDNIPNRAHRGKKVTCILRIPIGTSLLPRPVSLLVISLEDSFKLQSKFKLNDNSRSFIC